MTNDIPATPAAKDRELFFCALRGDLSRMDALLGAGANANTRQPRENYGQPVSALYAAADAGHLEAVRLLMRHGAKTEAGTPEGRTPLMAAVRRGDVEMAAFLVHAGAKTTIRHGTESLFDMAEKCDNSADMLRLLLSRIDVPKRADVLFEAARKAKPAIIEALASLPHFDVNARDGMGNTALILAAQNNERPGEAAAAVQMLLKLGAAIDAENDLKETPLSAAMTRTPVPAENVRLLVEAGADITRPTLAGLSCHDAAQVAGNEKILPCFEAARKQNVLREVRKFHEGSGNKITVNRPLKPRKPAN